MAYTPTFTYEGGANPPIDYPRLLISDTQEFAADGTTPAYVFSDEEIAAMTQIVRLQFQSGMFFSPPAGQNLPDSPVSYLRIAAGLLDCMAANKAKLAGVVQLLDVKLAPDKAAQWLRDMARQYRDTDDNSGSFVIIEQVQNGWSLQQRYQNQIQRQQGVPLG